MKRVLGAFFALALPALCAEASIVPQLVQHWTKSKAYTLAVAEAMPEEGYASKPNPEQMTFAQQLEHLAGANAYFLSKITGTPSPVGKPEKHDKAAVVRMLNESYDYVIRSVGSLTPEQLSREVDMEGMRMTGLDALLLAMDHTAHHRGQCVVYLRVKNIKPPGYKM